MTRRQVLDHSSAALNAAEWAVEELETTQATIVQLALIRWIVIECRRSTFVLQKLSSRVESWAAWYAPRQEALRRDPLMRYFHDLRTQIEKEGLPAAMAEVVDAGTGAVIADVSCSDGRLGIWVAGAARLSADGKLPEPGERDRDTMRLRSFRLIDPPLSHLGQDLSDFRFATLAKLAIEYLRSNILLPAIDRFDEGPAEEV